VYSVGHACLEMKDITRRLSAMTTMLLCNGKPRQLAVMKFKEISLVGKVRRRQPSEFETI